MNRALLGISYYFLYSLIEFQAAEIAAAPAAARAVLLSGLSVTISTATKACTAVLNARITTSFEMTSLVSFFNFFNIINL